MFIFFMDLFLTIYLAMYSVIFVFFSLPQWLRDGAPRGILVTIDSGLSL